MEGVSASTTQLLSVHTLRRQVNTWDIAVPPREVIETPVMVPTAITVIGTMEGTGIVNTVVIMIVTGTTAMIGSAIATETHTAVTAVTGGIGAALRHRGVIVRKEGVGVTAAALQGEVAVAPSGLQEIMTIAPRRRLV